MEVNPIYQSDLIEDQDFYLKIESVEWYFCNETIYVQISFEQHVVNVKGAFKLGNMQIYQDLHGKLQAYSADLISDNCLPDALEWNQEFYTRLYSLLTKQQKEAKYSFKNSDDKNIQLSKKFSVWYRVQTVINAEINYFTAILKQKVEPMQFHNFFLTVCRINDKSNKQIQGLKNKIEEKESTYTQIVETLEKERNQNQEKLDQQLFLFTGILNENKQKIKQLLNNQKQPDQQKLKEQQMEQEKFYQQLQSQHIQYTQFTEPQFTQMNLSLFKPSQDFNPQNIVQYNFTNNKKMPIIEEKDEPQKEYEEECKKFTRQNQEIKFEKQSTDNDMKSSLMDLFK